MDTATAGTNNGTLTKTQAAQRDDTLHQIKWRRIVLDEGHVIKNPHAKMSIACASLKAEYVLLFHRSSS